MSRRTTVKRLVAGDEEGARRSFSSGHGLRTVDLPAPDYVSGSNTQCRALHHRQKRIAGITTMIFKLKRSSDALVRPRVTPDPNQAAELERRMSAVEYYPENGFHRDRMQDRVEYQRLRRACA